MPKYEDFNVGDVWIRRDGGEAVITAIGTDAIYPVQARIKGDYYPIFTKDGFYRADKALHPYDLLRLKTPPLDLTKPLRFIGAVETFSAAEIENAPEPVMVKQWAVIAPEGGVEDFFDTYEEAREAFAHGQIVEMTGEYHV